MVHWKSAAWVFLALVFGACGPGASTLSFTVSAGNLSLVTGTSGTVTVTANFVSGSGSFPLSLELPTGLSGVTGSFAPASISNTSPGSVLTLNVAQSVAPQTYNLTVRAGSQTAPVALTVVPAFRVEARGGVYNLGSATPGTVLVWKIRRADGTLPTSAIALRFNGPPGWNGGQPITLSYPAATAGQSSIRTVDFLFRGATPPVAGSYTATATIEGQTYTSTFNLAVVQTLPQPSELIMQSVSSSQVVATWVAAERARSYWAAVSTSSDGVFRATLPDPVTTFSANLSASPAFNTTLAHDVRVYAFSADLSGSDPTLPSQIDASRQSTDINFSAGSGTLGGTVSIAPPAAASALDYSGTPLDSFVPGEVIIRFRQGISLQRAEPLRAGGVGLQFDRPLGLEGVGLYSTEPDPQSTLRAINELNLRPDVEYAQPNFIYLPTQLTPNDPQYPLQWHYPAINLPQAWSLENGSSNPVTVAVVDTGIFAAHPDFAGKLLPGYDFISSVSSAGDGDGRDTNPEESSPNGSTFHGSHVSGTVAAATNNATGVAGASWGARILPIRALAATGGTVADITDGMVWAAGGTVSGVPANPNPAQIVNMSLGGSRSCRRDPLYQQAINQARNLGAMVVVSSGNSTANTANFSPASCSGVVTVGASNSETQRAYYSNFGPRTDVMAPGGSTLISLNGQSQGGGVLSTRKGNSGEAVYSYLQGTSMAAPHVAGVLALMKSARPDLTPAEALDILKRTARPFSATQCSGEQGSQGGVRTLPPSLSAADCGAGLIDALAAVQAARAAPVPGFAVRPLDSGFGIGAGGSRLVTVNLDRWGGFTTPVSLSVQGLPGGVTAVFSANPTNSSSALQLTTSPTTAPGTYELTVLGEAGSQSRSAAFTLVVGVSPANQTLSGARVTAFFWNGTTEILANSRYVTLSSNTTSAPYTVSGLVGGSYYIEGWIDENGNGRYDDLDYIGNFLSGGRTAVVTAPRSDLNFELRPLLSLSSQSLQLLREGLQSRIFSAIQSPDPTSAARQGGEP